MAESLYPPHSRLFVACDKDTTESELTSVFQKYGTIENVKLCRDRDTRTPKGFAFVQMEKTSQAAAAMEALNGTTIGNSSRPIRVTVALSKDQKDQNSADASSQFLRLFLVVPKTTTEGDLLTYFSEFGEVDFVNIVKDRETKESKGYAYVKYKLFSDAARAYENCDRSYKVVFAKPKEQTSALKTSEYGSKGHKSYNEPRAYTHLGNNPDGYTSVRAVVSPDLTDEQVEWLFDIAPGLQYVRFFSQAHNGGLYGRKVLVQYDSPSTAAYAFHKINGFEYPPGHSIMIEPDFSYPDRMPGNERPMRGAPGAKNNVTDLMKQVETLTKSLHDATRMLQSAGVNAAPLGKSFGQMEAFRCSAKLPPPRPLAPPNSQCMERLFLVCEPGLPPQDALWDVFGRFGNLIELYILNGKNCGYAKYADKGSAARAIQCLNGQELYRMKMKVLVAEPQPGDRKRRKMDME